MIRIYSDTTCSGQRTVHFIKEKLTQMLKWDRHGPPVPVQMFAKAITRMAKEIER